MKQSLSNNFSMLADITFSHLGIYNNSPNFLVINERDSTPQDASIDDVIKSTYDASLEFLDKNYKGVSKVSIILIIVFSHKIL